MTTPPRNSASAKRSPGKGRAAGKSAAAKTAAPETGTADADEKAAPKDAQPDAPSAAQSAAKTESPAAAPTAFAPPPPVRTAGAARVLAWVTLVVGLCVGTAVVTWPWWSERLAVVFPSLAVAEGSDPALNQLTGRVKDLERQTREKSGTLQQLEQERARFQGELKTLMARLAEVEQAVADARHLAKAADAPASTAVAAESLKALSDRLAELEQGGSQVDALAERLEQIEKGQGNAPAPAAVEPDPAVKTALDAMAERLKRLEQETDGKNAANDDAAARAIVLAVAQLREAVREGTPFSADLEALKALADGRPAIAQSVAALAPQADSGVPTLAVLRTKFATLAGLIVAAAGTADGEGWIAEAAARLASLVTVRRIGETAPAGSVDALVARVDMLLAAGDLRSATDALTLLKGKPAEVVKSWLKAAEARLAAEKAVANLHVHALSLLAPAKAGG